MDKKEIKREEKKKYQITSVNFGAFKKKNLVLITTAVVGIMATTGTVLYKDMNKPIYGEYNGFAKPNYEDKIIWENYLPDETATVIFTYIPSNEYKIRAFKGKSEKTHYRINVMDYEGCCINMDDLKPIESTDWKELPEDGLITINRSDFSDRQYDNNLVIEYGNCDEKNNISDLDKESDEYEEIFCSNCSKEKVEKYNEYREKISKNVEKNISDRDSELEKVKKTYDYIIDHVAYDNRPYTYGEEDREYESIFGTFYTDCTGYADIMNYTLNKIGIKSYTVVDNTNGHVWNMARVDGKYYHLDATYSDIGSYKDTSKYRYFLVSDDFMRAENRWFIKEKDYLCNETYDLTGVVNKNNIEYRGVK